MNNDKQIFIAYRPFYASNGKIVKPGTAVKCTKLEAMCVNTMQPMTLRKKVDIETECTCVYKWKSHSCPFQEDVWDNHEDYCTCCPFCEQECLEAI